MKTWKITENDINSIAIGAGILGTGGGGSPYLGQLRVNALLEQGHTIELVLPEDLPDDAVVVSVGGIGAPTVGIEKMEEGNEGRRAIETIEKFIGRKVSALVADEVGGSNGMSPMIPAAHLGIPVVDADGMGRAFPETQMTSFFIGGLATAPSVLTDAQGNTLVVTAAESPERLERIMRDGTISMGCTAFMTSAPMSGAFVRENGISHSVSFCRQIGDAVRNARSEKADPVRAITEAARGAYLISGKVVDIERGISGGFVRGKLTISGLGPHKGREMEIDIQNEFIVARENQSNVAMVPDLICVVDSESGRPVATEELRYGMRVSALCLPAPRLFRSPKALDVVGPRAFGYDFDFVAVGSPHDPEPVANYHQKEVEPSKQ